jgi:hypothetical protein
MKYIQSLLLSTVVVLTFGAFASAQTEDDLKNYFEGKRVEVKIDMPATKDGINVYPERTRPLDYSRYSSLIKNFGLGVSEGDRIMITKIKVKDKHIEFQLGGGGYGTLGDETSSSVYIPSASKSRRERNLEKDIKYETDERRRRRLHEELSYLRRERQREDSQNRAEAAVAEEISKARIQEKRLQGGSRFNIRFDRKLTADDLTPQVIIDALAEYLYFSDAD